MLFHVEILAEGPDNVGWFTWMTTHKWNRANDAVHKISQNGHIARMVDSAGRGLRYGERYYKQGGNRE